MLCTYSAPATAFPRKKHRPMLTPTSGPRARPMRQYGPPPYTEQHTQEKHNYINEQCRLVKAKIE